MKRKGVLWKGAAALVLSLVVGAGIGWLRDPTWAALAGILGLLFVTTIVPAWRYRPNGDALNLLPLLATYYFLAFGAGGAYLLLAGDPDPRTRIQAGQLVFPLFVATVGWLALVAGYVLDPARGVAHLRVGVRPVQSVGAVVIRSLPLLAVGWYARWLTVLDGSYFHTLPVGSQLLSSGASWLVSTAAMLPTVLMVVFGAYGYLGGGNATARLIFKLLLAVEVVWALPAGTRATLLTIAGSIVLIAYYAHRRLPVRLLTVTVLVFALVVFPFYLLYRGNSDTYQLDPGSAFGTAAEEYLSLGPTGIIGSGIGATLSRFSDLKAPAVVLSSGGDMLPEAHGQTLVAALYAFIPRAVLPEKVDPGLFGNEVGRVTGMLQPTDYVSSIAFAQPFELLLTAQLPGVVVGMLVIGAIYRLVSDVTAGRRDNPLTLAIYAVSLLPLVTSLGVIVALGLVGTIKLMLVLGVALLILCEPTRVPVGQRKSDVDHSWDGRSSEVLA